MTHSNPERDEFGKRDSGQNIAGKLVVARGDPTKILEATEGILDQMAVAIPLRVIGDFAFEVYAAGNDGTVPGLRNALHRALAS